MSADLLDKEVEVEAGQDAERRSKRSCMVCTKCDAFMLFYTIVHSGRTTMPNAIYYEERHYPLRRHVETGEYRSIRERERQSLLKTPRCRFVLWCHDDTQAWRSSLGMRKENARSNVMMKSANWFQIPSCRLSSLASERLPFRPLRRSCPQASG